MTPNGQRITDALRIAATYVIINGAHHKAWVIDQMVRVLAEGYYTALIAQIKSGDDGPDTYAWDEGIAP